ncbi:MAG: hypothetical protein AABW53_00965 [Nanoarchaeota archaeon]
MTPGRKQDAGKRFISSITYQIGLYLKKLTALRYGSLTLMAIKKSLTNLLAAAAVSLALSCEGDAPESLVECLVRKDVQGYGAWWCEPCKYQKTLFEPEDWEYLSRNNYTECYGVDGLYPIEKCVAAEIVALPAWDFPTGREYGALTPEEFADISGCEYTSWSENDILT